jgi:hypothetical protein
MESMNPSQRRYRALLIACCLAGVAVRLGALALAPPYAFFSDHLDFMVWSAAAYRWGPTELYDLPPNTLFNTRLPRELTPGAGAGDAPIITPYPAVNACNYPPFSIDLLWVQGWIWERLDNRVIARRAGRSIAEYAGWTDDRPIRSPVVNTFASRLAGGAIPMLADFALAYGVLRIVRRLRRGAPSPGLELAAFGLVLLGPPIWLDSAFWTQMDSVVTAMLVWCVHELLARRYWTAGALYGVALLTKAQAILLAPALAFFALSLNFRDGGSIRAALGLWRTAAAAILAALALSMPQALRDARGDGPGPIAAAGSLQWRERVVGERHEYGAMRWFHRSYLGPIQEQFPYTTLKAFNIWWLDFVAGDQTPEALTTDTAIFGEKKQTAETPGTQDSRAKAEKQSPLRLSKTVAGRGLLAAAILGAAALCARRWRWGDDALVPFAAIVLLAAFVLPTRVHERYVYYCLPFLIAGLAAIPSWAPVVAAMVLVATFEMTWYVWLVRANSPLDAGASTREATVWSTVLAVLSVVSLVWAIVAVAIRAAAGSSRQSEGGGNSTHP